MKTESPSKFQVVTGDRQTDDPSYPLVAKFKRSLWAGRRGSSPYAALYMVEPNRPLFGQTHKCIYFFDGDTPSFDNGFFTPPPDSYVTRSAYSFPELIPFLLQDCDTRPNEKASFMGPEYEADLALRILTGGHLFFDPHDDRNSTLSSRVGRSKVAPSKAELGLQSPASRLLSMLHPTKVMDLSLKHLVELKHFLGLLGIWVELPDGRTERNQALSEQVLDAAKGHKHVKATPVNI